MSSPTNGMILFHKWKMKRTVQGNLFCFSNPCCGANGTINYSIGCEPQILYSFYVLTHLKLLTLFAYDFAMLDDVDWTLVYSVVRFVPDPVLIALQRVKGVKETNEGVTLQL